MVSWTVVHVVLLHGHDSSPARVAEFADALAEALPANVSTPVGPVKIGTESAAWWSDDEDQTGNTDDAVPDAVRAVRAQVELDGALVVGFSQGGALAVALGAAAESGVVGVVCGGGFLGPGCELRRGGPPLLVLHGEDDEVVDVFYAETLARSARRLGIDVTMDTYPGGHAWPPDAIERIAAWWNIRSGPSAEAGNDGSP